MKIALRVAICAGVSMAAIWFVTATEWVEVDVPQPPRGAAARDQLHAARKLLAKLGMKLESRTNLDALPPRGARLLLTSSHWALLKDRPKQLEDWVRNGGHLVVPGFLLDPVTAEPRGKPLGWLPVGARPRPPQDYPDKRRAPRTAPSQDPDCHQVSDTHQMLRMCSWPYWRDLVLVADARTDWQIRNEARLEAIRVDFGQGSVTVLGPSLMYNGTVLRGDDPYVFAEAMQAERGAVAWIVSEESREKLVPWVIENGWVAVTFVLLAVAAGLWRSAVRFGPVALPATRAHRSMAEQVTGTAHFLMRHGPRALHEAQLRALHEAAARHVAGYASADARRRVALVAARTSLREDELSDAMRSRIRDRREIASALSVMETARRRLDAAASLPAKEKRNADQQ